MTLYVQLNANLYTAFFKAFKYDVSDWKKVKKLKPAQNPKYCYIWSFDNPKKSIAVCIWHPEIQIEGNRIFQARNLRGTPSGTNPIKVATWKRRAKAVDGHLQAAYLPASDPCDHYRWKTTRQSRSFV
jgi:hypothetical protein